MAFRFNGFQILMLYFVGIKLSLDYYYYAIISKTIGWKHIFLWNPDANSFFASWLFTFILIFTFPKMYGSFLFYFFILFDSFIVLPIINLQWATGQSLTFASMVIIVDCIMHVVASLPMNRIYLHLDRMVASKDLLIYTSLIGMALFTLILVVASGGVDARAWTFYILDNKSAYELRDEIQFVLGTGYIYNWITKSMFCFVLCVALYNKNRSVAFVVIVLQCILFSCYGQKMALFSIVFVFLVYYLFAIKKKGDAGFLFFLILMVLCGLLMPSIEALKKYSDFYNLQFGIRTLYLPALIQYEYFGFFQSHEFLYFSEGLIGKLFGISYPYYRPIGMEVSAFFLGEGNGGNHNAGIFADAYSNFGFLGMIIFGIGLGYLLNIIDKLSFYIPTRLKVTIMGLYVMFLANNAFQTTLLTNGLFIVIIMFALYNPTFYLRKLRNGKDY